MDGINRWVINLMEFKMKLGCFNKGHIINKIKNVAIVCSFLFLLSSCTSKFTMLDQNTIGPVSLHQKIFILEYETPKRWMEFSDLRKEKFSDWLLRGFNQLLNDNDIESSGIVITHDDSKKVMKAKKRMISQSGVDGVLQIKPDYAHYKDDMLREIVYNLTFYSLKNGKKVKVWEGTGRYYLPNAKLTEDPEVMYHLHADKFVNEVLSKLQQSGFIKPLTLFVTE